MQVRFSTCRGTPVVDEEVHSLLGVIDHPLIHPDTGKVEGFFVHAPGILSAGHLFLATSDIRRWGRKVEVRDSDSLGPLHEHVRLEHLSKDPRHFLGQRMTTEQGRPLGRCGDVQFDTSTFHLQWLFPRKFRFFWGTPIPASSVLEVKPRAIIVKEQVIPQKEEPAAAELVTATPTPA